MAKQMIEIGYQFVTLLADNASGGGGQRRAEMRQGSAAP